MIQDKKYVIIRIVIVILIIIFLVILFSQNKKPANIIKEKFGLILPSSAKVMHFNNNIMTGEFNAKIQFNEQDLDNIKKDLLKYFKQEYFALDNLPRNENFVSWWDVDKNNIESCYKKVTGERNSHVSIIVWAFIVSQDDGTYYLYISYL